MFVILLLTVLGFLVGLIYVMAKRKIKPGKILSTTFATLLLAGIYKIFKDYYKRGGKRWGY